MKVTKTRKHMFLALVAACSLATGGAVLAQAAPQPATADADAHVVKLHLKGEVVALDKAARSLDIKGPRGNVASYLVDPVVKNFDQIKVGDIVQLDYRAAVALALSKGGSEIREKVESQSASVAPPGSKPGMAAEKRSTLVANVEKVDRKHKVATLKGPNGRVVDVQVNDPSILNDLKPGDQVVANVTESIAIQVRPAKTKQAAQ